MTQAVETLSGGQRQCVAVGARQRLRAMSSSWTGHRRPGREGGQHGAGADPPVRDKNLPVILISHNMPHVFEIADRIHIARLGKRAAVVNPKKSAWRHRGRDDWGHGCIRPARRCPPDSLPCSKHRPPADPRPAQGAGRDGPRRRHRAGDANFTAMSLGAGKPVLRLPGISMARAVQAVASVLPWRKMCRTPWPTCRWAAPRAQNRSGPAARGAGRAGTRGCGWRAG